MATFKHLSGKRIHFIHIPRTGGRFIEQNLIQLNDFVWDDYKEKPAWGQKRVTVNNLYGQVEGLEIAHFTRELYEKHLDVEGVPHITVIRDPIKRFISGSMFINKYFDINNKLFDDDIQERMEDPEKFKTILTDYPFTWHTPQLDFITDDTHIWRFEDGLGDDFAAWLSGIIGIDITIRQDVQYDEHSFAGDKLTPTPKLIDNIRSLYEKDIEQLYPELAA